MQMQIVVCHRVSEKLLARVKIFILQVAHARAPFTIFIPGVKARALSYIQLCIKTMAISFLSCLPALAFPSLSLSRCRCCWFWLERVKNEIEFCVCVCICLSHSISLYLFAIVLFKSARLYTIYTHTVHAGRAEERRNHGTKFTYNWFAKSLNNFGIRSWCVQFSSVSLSLSLLSSSVVNTAHGCYLFPTHLSRSLNTDTLHCIKLNEYFPTSSCLSVCIRFFLLTPRCLHNACWRWKRVENEICKIKNFFPSFCRTFFAESYSQIGWEILMHFVNSVFELLLNFSLSERIVDERVASSWISKEVIESHKNTTWNVEEFNSSLSREH